MQEFVYYNPVGLDFPLEETIKVTSNIEDIKNSSFLVSNTAEIKSEVVANEIDFYIKNSNDPISDKISNVNKLYEISATRFDSSQEIQYNINIENKVLVIADLEDTKEFAKNISKDEFDLFFIDDKKLVNIEGSIGDFRIIIKHETTEVTIKVDQIVWFNAKKEKIYTRAGIYDPCSSSIDEVLTKLRENIISYSYGKFITYDSNICQYHERREEICSKCEEVCPSTAIVKDDSSKHLHLSQVDCHGCGGCVSICPSGAIDYAPSSRESIHEISRFYEDTIPLIIPNKMDISSLDISLKEKVLPFKIDGEKFLHESTLLTLLQESGSQIVFYTDFLSKGTKDSISILNQIYQAKYKKDAVLVAMDENELKTALLNVDFIEDSKYKLSDMVLRKRENFSIRLAKIVGDDNLGSVHTGEHVHYAKVELNESNCTLCLSCVGACNVNAIFADAKDNTLRLNPSLCTACGYCEASCPELDCLTIKRDIIELEPMWFKENILAKDELFPCVECGKEFATKKAIEKIAAIMSPIFVKDPIKQRTLYCCEDCKPKVMMKSYMSNPTEYNNKQGIGIGV